MSSFTTSSSSADEFSPLQPIFPNLSPSEEMSVLIARIAELNRAKTMEPSVASSEVFGQDGYGMNDDGFSLNEEEEEEEEDEQQEDRKTPTKDVSEDHLKAILERIGEIEKQQQQQTKAFLQSQNDQKKILEKISEIEKQKQKKVFLKFQENCWDSFACHEDIEISGDKSLIVHQKKNDSGYWRSVFAKYPIVLNKHLSDFFYYEISVMKKKRKNLLRNKSHNLKIIRRNLSEKSAKWIKKRSRRECFGGINFGFAVKQQTKLDGPFRTRKGTYAYESDGDICINGQRKGTNAKYSYGEGDTVGIGVHFASRQMIFTKNKLNNTSDFLVDPSFADGSLYPFVSLGLSGDKIEANFGPNFKFDLETL
ncbi:hypothetical protein niasHS_016713 [Heterodera schachtii]|uniref:B30.2/SPRY domain-containing protein n=1 Tax=Heterodera schachtii TaxID=97005 RepID=A0ABD2HT03_HETSC